MAKKISKTETPVGGRTVGYARISTRNQSLDEQITLLQKAGCEPIYHEVRSAAAGKEQPHLEAAIEQLKVGDTLVVTALDRLGRSLSRIVSTVNDLLARGVQVKLLKEGMTFSNEDTSPMAKAIRSFWALMAELEHDILVERLADGRAYAVEHLGKKMGRKKSLNDEKVLAAKKMISEGTPIAQVARLLNVDRRTLYRYLDAEDINPIGRKNLLSPIPIAARISAVRKMVGDGHDVARACRQLGISIEVFNGAQP